MGLLMRIAWTVGGRLRRPGARHATPGTGRPLSRSAPSGDLRAAARRPAHWSATRRLDPGVEVEVAAALATGSAGACRAGLRMCSPGPQPRTLGTRLVLLVGESGGGIAERGWRRTARRRAGWRRGRRGGPAEGAAGRGLEPDTGPALRARLPRGPRGRGRRAGRWRARRSAPCGPLAGRPRGARPLAGAAARVAHDRLDARRDRRGPRSAPPAARRRCRRAEALAGAGVVHRQASGRRRPKSCTCAFCDSTIQVTRRRPFTASSTCGHIAADIGGPHTSTSAPRRDIAVGAAGAGTGPGGAAAGPGGTLGGRPLCRGLGRRWAERRVTGSAGATACRAARGPARTSGSPAARAGADSTRGPTRPAVRRLLPAFGAPSGPCPGAARAGRGGRGCRDRRRRRRAAGRGRTSARGAAAAPSCRACRSGRVAMTSAARVSSPAPMPGRLRTVRRSAWSPETSTRPEVSASGTAATMMRSRRRRSRSSAKRRGS